VGTDQVWFDPSPTGCASTDVCEPVSQGSTTAATTRAEFPGNSTIQITRIEESHAFRCAPDESATRPRGCRRGSVGCRLWRLDPSCPSDEGDNTSTDYRVGHLVGVGHTVQSGRNLVSSGGVTTSDSVRGPPPKERNITEPLIAIGLTAANGSGHDRARSARLRQSWRPTSPLAFEHLRLSGGPPNSHSHP
jgi:hypothetical protein